MRQVLVVVDDFYDDFDAVRQRALGAAYEPVASGNYPGRNSVESFAAGEALSKLALFAGRRGGRWGSGRFRSSSASDVGKFDVHVDMTELSAIVFLNTAEQSAGRIATSFWRHRRTGLTGIPRGAGSAECARISEEIIVPDSRHRDRWELTLEIHMAPNRLIIFPSRMFHSPHDSFGDDLASSRLIQTFFLLPR